MKKIRKNSVLAVLLAAVMLTATACGGMKPEDAKAYAKSVLDASYKGEFKEYIEQTKSSKSEAKAMYDMSMDKTLDAAGFSSLGLSEGLIENYKKLFQDMAKQAEYSVGKAKEAKDDSFTVDVKIKPYTTFEGVSQETQAAFAEVTPPSTEAEANELMYQKMYEIMSARMKTPVYGEESIVTIHVKQNSKKIYEIPTEDLSALDEAMFPMDNF